VSTLLVSNHSAMADEKENAIPQILIQMQLHSQTMIDTLLNKELPQAIQQYEQLSREINQLHRLTTLSPNDEHLSRELLMTYSWMRMVDIEINKQSWVEAAISANQLSGMIIQASHFHTLLARDLAWLGYLSRDIELLTLENSHSNSDLLNIRTITLENTWQRVSSELIREFRNKPLLLEGDALLSRLKQSAMPDQTVQAAKNINRFIQHIQSRQAQ